MKSSGGKATKVPDYRRMLDDKDVHAVLIGVPDHWHKAMTLEAIAAGKDVYVEKPVSHSIAEGVAMVTAVEASKQVVQTGTQQRSSDHWILGKQIVDAGKLGQVTFVQTYCYQLRSTQPLSEVDLARLDWKRWLGPARDQPFDAEPFQRWRHFKGLRRGRADGPPDPLDRRGPLVHGGGYAADRGLHRVQLPHEDVAMARYRDRNPRISKRVHGDAHRNLRQRYRRRRPRVPWGPGHAQDRPGAPARLQRREPQAGLRAGPGAGDARALAGRRLHQPPAQLARVHPQPQGPERAHRAGHLAVRAAHIANAALGLGARVRFDEKTGKVETL